MWHTKPYADIFAGMKVLHMAYRSFADLKWVALQCEHSETHDPPHCLIAVFLIVIRILVSISATFKQSGKKSKSSVAAQLTLFQPHWLHVSENVRKMCGKCS
jgi:hypothetical protein